MNVTCVCVDRGGTSVLPVIVSTPAFHPRVQHRRLACVSACVCVPASFGRTIHPAGGACLWRARHVLWCVPASRPLRLARCGRGRRQPSAEVPFVYRNVGALNGRADLGLPSTQPNPPPSLRGAEARAAPLSGCCPVRQRRFRLLASSRCTC